MNKRDSTLQMIKEYHLKNPNAKAEEINKKFQIDDMVSKVGRKWPKTQHYMEVSDLFIRIERNTEDYNGEKLSVVECQEFEKFGYTACNYTKLNILVYEEDFCNVIKAVLKVTERKRDKIREIIKEQIEINGYETRSPKGKNTSRHKWLEKQGQVWLYNTYRCGSAAEVLIDDGSRIDVMGFCIKDMKKYYIGIEAKTSLDDFKKGYDAILKYRKYCDEFYLITNNKTVKDAYMGDSALKLKVGLVYV